MIKSNSISQGLVPKPKKMLKSNSESIALCMNTNSKTPTIKPIKNPLFIKTNASIRETQSSASSPQQKFSNLNVLKLSSSPKEKIKSIVKNSLQKFKNQKQELERIKELSKSWKEHRKKKLEEYNEQTRNENKAKFKFEAFRPKTAWGSPEPREFLTDIKKNKPKNSGYGTSFDRRANIGLEFYNLRTPRNTTPKALKEKGNCKLTKKVQKKSKEIEDFIKKKRKERKKIENNLKEQEEEFEMKRMIQLMQIERLAKKALKKRKKSANNEGKKQKKQKKKISTVKKIKFPKIVQEESFNLLDSLKKESMSCSEDEEVVNIMQVRRLEALDQEKIEGRECAIFGNFSNQFEEGANATEIANNIVEKRIKNEKNSILISSSMPIIELKSISNESSLETSEKLNLIKKIHSSKYIANKNKEKIHEENKEIASNNNNFEKKMREIFFEEERKDKVENLLEKFSEHEKIEDSEGKNSEIQKNLNFERGIKNLFSCINTKILSRCFLAIKMNPKSHEVSLPLPDIISESAQEQKYKKISNLDLMLDNLAKKNKRESIVIESLWDNFDFISRTINYINEPKHSLPVTLNTDNSLQLNKKKSSHSLEKPNIGPLNNIPNEGVTNIDGESIESNSKIIFHDYIESPICDSDSFSNSTEILDISVYFFMNNFPALEILPQTEPISLYPHKNFHVNSFQHLCYETFPSVLLENSESTKENSSSIHGHTKGKSSLNEIDLDKNDSLSYISYDSSDFSQNFSDSNSDRFIEKILLLLMIWLYSEYLEIAISRHSIDNSLKSLNNYASVTNLIPVKTDIIPILNYVEKILNLFLGKNKNFIQEFSRSENFQQIYLENLRQNGEKSIKCKFHIPDEIFLKAEEQSDYNIFLSLPNQLSKSLKLHNSMIFECINFYFSCYNQNLLGTFWEDSEFTSNKLLEVDILVKEVKKKISKDCKICAGKIPTPEMYGKNHELDEDALQKAREIGLSRLLVNDIYEDDNFWTNYRFEENKIIAFLSENVFEEIVTDEIFFLHKLLN